MSMGAAPPTGVVAMGYQFAGEEHGLEESLNEFRLHNNRVADALLNLNDGVKLTAERPRYNPDAPENQWPKMTYHADGREEIVTNADELGAQRKLGFRTEPYIKVRIALGDPKAEKKALETELKAKDGRIATLHDDNIKMQETLQQLTERLESLESKKK